MSEGILAKHCSQAVEEAELLHILYNALLAILELDKFKLLPDSTLFSDIQLSLKAFAIQTSELPFIQCTFFIWPFLVM